MYRYYYLKKLPEAFENYFVTNNEIHNYTIQEMQQNYTSVVNKGVNLWNTLDTKFKRINSYSVYKRLIKQHVIVS
jgi:hypothetical protein